MTKPVVLPESSAATVGTSATHIYKSPRIEEYGDKSFFVRNKGANSITTQLWASPTGTGDPIANAAEWTKVGSTVTIAAGVAGHHATSEHHEYFAVTGTATTAASSATVQTSAHPRV